MSEEAKFCPARKGDGGKPGEETCPVCMGAGKLWCAMCGKFGDHLSGGCPEFCELQLCRDRMIAMALDTYAINMPDGPACELMKIAARRILELQHLNLQPAEKPA